MRKLSILYILIFAFLLTACGDKEQLAAYEQQVLELEQKIAELENTNQEQKIVLEKYNNIIFALENNSYDNAVSLVNDIKEERYYSNLEANGYFEIEINIDNWQEYFEYIPYCYKQKNDFDEIIEFYTVGAIKLKDDYIKVSNGGTEVTFEYSPKLDIRPLKVDFESGEFEYGDIIGEYPNEEPNSTFKFNDHNSNNYDIDIVEFLTWDFIRENSDNPKEIIVPAIKEMIRAEGKLVIYNND